MALTYDFDMFSIIPKEVQAQFGGMLNETGMTNKVAEQVALFRDPAAVEALRGAAPEVQKLMIGSGFGLNVYDSGAGTGKFPASDGPARAAIMERLLANLEGFPDGLNWNGFDIEDFAMAALNAKPLDTPAQSLSDMRTQAPSAPDQPSGVDQAFAATPPPPQQSQPSGSNLDDFFSAKPAATGAPTVPDATPNMDAFFSDTSDTAAKSQVSVSRPMTVEDIRMTIDDPMPKKSFGFGPVKMGLMALGLFLVISMLGSGGGLKAFVEAASGGKMVAIGN